MTILTPANALLGIPFPQHKSGQSSVQSFNYPGAVQPNPNPPPPSVLSATQALLGIVTPNRTFPANTVRSFFFPGAVQPAVNAVLNPPVGILGLAACEY